MAEQGARYEAVDCPSCRRHVAAEVKGTVWVDYADWLVSLVECPKCDSPLLVEQEVDPPHDISPPNRLWPQPSRQFPLDAPLGLRLDFTSAVQCYSRGDYTASAIMTRRCLEGLAMELGAEGRSLAQRLESLKAKGAIEGYLFDWASALRMVGNDAAHNTAEQVVRQDAEDVLLFAEALSEHIYTISRKFEEFQARRAAKAKTDK